MSRTRKLQGLLAAVPLLFAGATAQATEVFGIQAALGRIVTIDPTTGAITNTYATPQAISPLRMNAGLSYAAALNQLLYFDAGQSATLYRLNPTTGAVQSSVSGDTYFTTTAGVVNSGLSYERVGGQDYLYYAHQNVDTHLQVGFGGGESPFFNQPSGTGNPTEGLGGDGYGREFSISSDGIHEFNPFNGNDVHILAAFPLVDLALALGLAYDGQFLYVSTSLGQLLTLNADTGAVLNRVNVLGGSLIELGARGVGAAAAVPEPAPPLLLGIGALVIAATRLRRRR